MRRALVLFLALQALLGVWNLGLLSPWMDEAGTLFLERESLTAAVITGANDIHPPLFYTFLWLWQRLPLGLDEAVQARLLTVLIGLLATFAADQLLGSRLPTRARTWFLALWCVSPSLLLYSRMCRSYSLQVLVTVVAIGYLLRYLDRPQLRLAAILGAAALAAIYTHYVPGVAVILVENIALGMRGKWKDSAVMNGLIAIGILPWIVWLAQSLTNWARHENVYAAIGGPAEWALKAAYWAMSLMTGEAVPDVLLMVAILLAPWLAWQLRGADGRLAWITLALGLIGFIGVGRWVSYPFISARMLFVVPLILLLFTARASTPAMAALLALWIAGDWCYFHKLDFRNKQYPLPVRELVRQIRPQDAVLVDATNSDPLAVRWALGAQHPVVLTTDEDATRKLGDPRIATVWFLRNTHDVSPQRWNARFEQDLSQKMRLVEAQGYGSFTALEQRLMIGLGMGQSPKSFTELLRFEKPAAQIQLSRSANVP